LPLIQTINGQTFSPLLAIDCTITVADKIIPITAYVLKDCPFDILLGIPACEAAELNIKFSHKHNLNLTPKPVRIAKHQIIPPSTVAWIDVTASLPLGDYYLEKSRSAENRLGILIQEV
jgi:hypothetical protein